MIERAREEKRERERAKQTVREGYGKYDRERKDETKYRKCEIGGKLEREGEIESDRVSEKATWKTFRYFGSQCKVCISGFRFLRNQDEGLAVAWLYLLQSLWILFSLRGKAGLG